MDLSPSSVDPALAVVECYTWGGGGRGAQKQECEYYYVVSSYLSIPHVVDSIFIISVTS